MSSNLALVICSAILTVCNSVPLYWHVRQGNSGPIAMGVWVLVATLTDFVNFATWHNDAVNRAPIWCDISVKIRLGVQVGRLAAVACIARFLADVVSPRATALTRRDRRHRAIFDYSVAFGFPLLLMACHVLYQPNRFTIVRGIGCAITQTLTWPTILLGMIWGPIFSAIGVLYSSYTVYRLIRHRRNFRHVVSGAHSALTTSRFLHLLALSVSYLFIGVPLSISSTISYVRTSGKYYDYSWEYIHSAWHLYPIVQISKPTTADFYNWSDVIVGFIYLAAFGVGTEAFQKIVAPARRWLTASSTEKSLPVDARTPVAVDVIAFQDTSRSCAKGIKVVIEREEDVV
uniref:Mating pheromone receptor a2 n=1 Tax=Sporobolomyces longiusculus TaxID=217517 RepID=G8H2N0_9BASI|nr:mating pheromone receptor a2 [Sporobolomyces longiusculus]